MTTKEMIEVMQAYADGKTIEVFTSTHTWHDITEPNWNWEYCKYRVKEEPKYRPYKDCNEFINDVRNRYTTIQNPGFGGIWLKSKLTSVQYVITAIDTENETNVLFINNEWKSLNDLFINFRYLDGTKFGILEN